MRQFFWISIVGVACVLLGIFFLLKTGVIQFGSASVKVQHQSHTQLSIYKYNDPGKGIPEAHPYIKSPKVAFRIIWPNGRAVGPVKEADYIIDLEVKKPNIDIPTLSFFSRKMIFEFDEQTTFHVSQPGYLKGYSFTADFSGFSSIEISGFSTYGQASEQAYALVEKHLTTQLEESFQKQF